MVAPQGFTIPSVDFDPRVGAAYRIEVQPPGGESFYLVGGSALSSLSPPSRIPSSLIFSGRELACSFPRHVVSPALSPGT